MAEDTVPPRRPLNKKGAAFIKKLDKERVKNANTSARGKRTSSSGTFGSSERMADAKKDRGVRRGKGELVRRPDYSVTEYKKPGTSVVEVKKPGTAVVEYKGPSASTAASNVAGKALGRSAMRFAGPVGALVSMTEETNKGEREFMDMIRKKAGKGYGDKPVGPFKPAAKTTVAVRKEYPGSNTGNRAVRKASGTYTASYDVKEAPKAKSETPKVKSATIKTATDKSRVAPKTTNYQRMQAKQLEKEGYAGRSLTRAQAQKMAGAKSGANTTSLMVLFGISKPKTEKKTPTGRTGPLKSAFAQRSYQGRKK